MDSGSSAYRLSQRYLLNGFQGGSYPRVPVDGRNIEAPYVGPVRLDVAGRVCFVGALVFGDEVLLGAIPMEDLDLLVDPARKQVIPRDLRGPVSVAK